MKQNFPSHLIRTKPKTEKTHVTSVNIREDQKQFLEENGLNLSAVTREAIDALMGKRKATK